MERLYNLDYLRGLCAFGIMIYHYLSWKYGNFSSASFFGKLGLYGVSIFYVLSGLTLYYVYYKKLEFKKLSVFTFFKKRFFRIFPLLWLVNIASLTHLYFFEEYFPSPIVIFLNFTGLFGFVGWWAYLATGAWSIGNELVFYVFFPFFIYLTKHKKLLMILLSVILFAIYLYFAFEKIQPNLSISAQWKDYVNPLNQVFLFLGGFLLGKFFIEQKINNFTVLCILAMSFLAFIFYPVYGDGVNLITGKERITFTLLCFTICLGFYKLSIKLPIIIHKPLTLLGEMSYSIYLLHPIVWKFFNDLIFNSQNREYKNIIGGGYADYQVVMCLTITIIISYYVYKYFELYFMRLGRKIKLPFFEK